MEGGVAPPAALVLTLLSLALVPLAAAETQPPDLLLDVTGPDVVDIVVTPNPVLPYVVTVNATAVDAESNVTQAEFWIDSPGIPGFSSFQMGAVDGYDSPAEAVYWSRSYDDFTRFLAPGLHRILVHARDEPGNWGPFGTAAFVVADPATTGPTATALSASPPELPKGAPLTVEAFLYDPFGRGVVAGEFFFDGEGAAGTGTNLSPEDGAFGGSAEMVNWSGVVDLPPGGHAIWVHGLNEQMVWGPVERVAFTLRAPVITLQLHSDRTEVQRGEVVTYSVLFENRGNADATEVWIDLGLPPLLAYEGDTAADEGGSRVGPATWHFPRAPVGDHAFDVWGRLSPDARDGEALSATARLDYSNDGGWDFSEVSAAVTSSVVAPEVRVSVQAPDVVYAGETFDLVIDLEHTGTRTIPSLDVVVERGAWVSPTSDNAAALGGESLEAGRWRFFELAPNSYRFVITERVAVDAVDRAVDRLVVAVEYISRFAFPVSLPWELALTAARPSLEVATEPSPVELRAGDEVTFVVGFANRGSAMAGDVEVVMTLPEGLDLVGGDAPSLSSSSRFSWRFSFIAPEAGGQVSIVVAASRVMVEQVRLELSYSSPNGEFLGFLASSLSVTVRPVPSSPVTPAIAGLFAGVSLALLAFAATERGKTGLLFLLFLPLYTRLRHEKVLDHETRGMIRGYIVANPGDHYNSIKEALELPNGTLAYHIQVLQKEMIVRSVKDGKFRRFYPAEMRIPEGGEPTKIQRVVLDLIRTNPGMSPRDVAGLLGMTSSTVSYHLEKLEEHGRVEFRREGITKRLYVRGDLQAP